MQQKLVPMCLIVFLQWKCSDKIPVWRSLVNTGFLAEKVQSFISLRDQKVNV